MSKITRRTHEERRDTTRKNIFSAAIDCISEYGYHGTTTALIASRSGVTRGALQHQFGSRRIDLMVQLAEHVYDIYYTEFSPIIQSHNPKKMIADIWELQKELYRKKETIVLIELWLACRSDKDLGEQLIPLFARLDKVFKNAFLVKKPSLTFMNGSAKGWLKVTVTKKACTAEWCFVDTVEDRRYQSDIGHRLTIDADSY